MPPRQPPRPAPRPAKAPKGGGSKGGSRGGAKGGSKGGARGGAKGGARGKAAPKQPMTKGAKAAQNAEQQRQHRAMLDQQRRMRETRWWAANQVAMHRLHATQHHAAGGEAIGTVLNGDRRLRWRTSRAIGAITLLIFCAFFAAMALGAGSVGIALLSFLCLAGFIAIMTIEYSARRFPQPVPQPPLIGEHRLEDLIVEDEPPRTRARETAAPASLDALEEMFDGTNGAGQGSAPAESRPEPEPEPVSPSPSAGPVVEPATSRRPEAAPDPVDVQVIEVAPPEAEDRPEPDLEPEPPRPEPETASDHRRIAEPAAAPANRIDVPIPTPPRPRSSPEKAADIPDDLAELLLSEQALNGADVTDVAATLIVADLRRSIEFYSDALGLSITDRTDEAAVLDAGFGKILLWERPDAPPGETGVMHLTFEVGDIDAAFTKMNDAGVEFMHLPRTALLGQNYEMRAAAFRDPDGHGLAITEHRERES
ncbi:VOC family protein [Glycomyces salinus]|uniref:VOC family protein n=1 Tax=Glycomyces salinus TaxID=980294 RepID=UPI0018EA3DB1|nr:VOC family protein [Glycomyces salinus]